MKNALYTWYTLKNIYEYKNLFRNIFQNVKIFSLENFGNN